MKKKKLKLKFELLKGKTFQDVLINSPYIGILIYHDKYVFANPYMCNLLGYTLEEFLKLKPEEVHYFEKDREKIREIVKRRLQGEYFLEPYKEIILKTKDNKKVYVTAFSQTIFYEGKFAGLVFIIDKTKEKRYQRLYEILRRVNQILIEAYSEKEFFERICKALVKEFKIKMIWVVIPDYEKKLIKPIYWFGEERGYLKKIKVSMKESEPEGRGPVGEAFRKNEVVIISDTEANERFLPWREPALKSVINLLLRYF